MAISLVQSGRVPSQGSSTLITCTLSTQTLTVGNLVVVFWQAANATRTFSSATDDTAGGPNDWSSAKDGTDQSNATTGSMGSFSAVITNAGAAPATITLTLAGGASGGANAWCGEFSSTNGWPAAHANFYDQQVTGVCTSGCTATAVSSGTLTAAQASELIVGAVKNNAGAVRTISSSDLGELAPTFATSAIDHSGYLASASYNSTVGFVQSSAPTTWYLRATAYKDNAAAGANDRRVIMVS